ncbi:neutral amino acid permease [Fusarium pseudocircinatum]|uniref:Neutral amino acid permease n=1 Tax=Fusarium pseudocircinatum TaxID=56676 RepID=A0A8H5PYC5_9HYPO|nr:neutral amino acid permease [Fusarium pseudocircinatum]
MSHPKTTNDSDVIVAGEKQDGIHRQASFSEATAQMFQTDLEKEKTIQGTAHFHRLGWKRLTVVLIVQAIALGSLSLPGAFATLGMVAGVISCIGIGLIAMYASYMVGLVKLKYPDVDHYVDAGRLLMGGFGDKLFAVVFLGLLILATGSHCLTGTIALVKITGSSVCTLAFGVISAVILMVLAIPPSFTEIAILGYIDFISIILAIGITMIATGIQRSDAPGGFSSSTWSAWPQDDLSFTQALTAVSNIVFSYAFAAAQFSFMSEMHTPADFTKSIVTLGLTEIVLYTITGSVIYAFVGQEVQSPALLSASPLVSKVAFGIALPVIYISGSINATVACRFIHGRLYKNSITRFINTRKGWITWLAVVAFVIFLSWVIAEAIPFFSELLGICAALFISGFSFWIPPIMWFFLLKEGNWYDKHNVKRAACNCVVFVVGFFVFIAGTTPDPLLLVSLDFPLCMLNSELDSIHISRSCPEDAGAAGHVASDTEDVTSHPQNVKSAVLEVLPAMDELRRIKSAVKQNFRRVKTIQNRQLARSTAQAAQASRTKATSRTEVEIPQSPAQVGFSTTNTIFREAQYLVHYLDYIFPIQYAFYVDAPDQGGRGWLFFLLERNAPLRNAALTLSAFHQHTFSPYHTENQEDELLKYHTKALQELRQVVRHRDVGASADNIEEWLKFLAGGMFLISFEVFQGGTNNWQAHFNALASVIQNLTSSDFDFDASDPSSSDFDFQRGMNTAQKFILSNLVWIDILAPLATGTAPRLPYHDWLNAGKIDMSRVMGCSNCIMIAIGDMMALDSKAMTMDSGALQIAIDDLERRIHDGIDAASDDESTDLTPTNRSVTHLFATAALVQLYTLASEHNITSPDPHSAVLRVIEVLDSLPPHISLRAMPWPLCVAGSMALPPNEQYFDGLLTKLVDHAEAGFTNCGTVYSVMQNAWKQRRRDPSRIWSARQSMEDMGICALLI